MPVAASPTAKCDEFARRGPRYCVIFSIAMFKPSRFVLVLASGAMLAACKPAAPPPDIIKPQREAMERAKKVGETMQKGVDAEGRKADEESK
jgi:hypothetical protein